MKLAQIATALCWLGSGLVVAQAPRLPFAVELEAEQTVSSASAAVGQIVIFKTVKPFAAGGQEFAAGTIAAGKVVVSDPGRRFARGGLLEIAIVEIQLEDGRTFPLNGIVVFRGGSRTAGMAGGALALGLLTSPFAAPSAALLRGKAAIMPAGSLVIASFGPADAGQGGARAKEDSRPPAGAGSVKPGGGLD